MPHNRLKSDIRIAPAGQAQTSERSAERGPPEAARSSSILSVIAACLRAIFALRCWGAAPFP